MQLPLNVVCLSLGSRQAENTAARTETWTQTESDSKDKVQQLKLMWANDGKDRVGNGKVLLTHSTLQVLKEPVQDDTSHQRGRQIHLNINWTRTKGEFALIKNRL